MSRQYTDADIQQMCLAEQSLRESGLDVDYAGSTHNANTVREYFDQNETIPVTFENIIKFCHLNASLIWRTPAQRAYDRVSRQYPEHIEAVRQLMSRQKTLINTGEELFYNMAVLLPEFQGRQVTSETFYAAVSRVQTKKAGTLYFIPQVKQSTSTLHNHSTDAPVEQPKEDGYVNGRKNWADPKWNPKPVEQRPASPTVAWKMIATNLRGCGRTHSERDQMERLYQQAESGQRPWRQVATEMEQFKKSIENPRLVSVR